MLKHCCPIKINQGIGNIMIEMCYWNFRHPWHMKSHNTGSFLPWEGIAKVLSLLPSRGKSQDEGD